MSNNPNCLLKGASQAEYGIALYRAMAAHNIVSPLCFGRCASACGECGLKLTVIFPIGDIDPGPKTVSVEIDPGEECIDINANQYAQEIADKYSWK